MGSMGSFICTYIGLFLSVTRLYYVKKYVCAIENEETIYCCKLAIYLSLIAIFFDAIMLSI